MSRQTVVVAVLGIGFLLGWEAVAHAADVRVKNTLGVPSGVVVTLTHGEAQKVARGEKFDVPGLPSRFEKPFRGLAAKVKAAEKGNGVIVTLTVKVGIPPGIKSKVVAR